MNRDLIRLASVFAAGTGFGALIHNIYIKRSEQNMYEEWEDSDTEKLGERINKFTDIKDASFAFEAVKEDDPKVLVMQKDQYKRIVTNYNKPLEPGFVTKEDVKQDTQFNPKPYPITTEEFSEERDDFEKLTIYYYENDDTLTDENEEIISDVLSVVGDEALNSFGYGSVNPDIVYVRNEKMKTDYEIIRLTKSYSETVLGFAPQDSNKGARRHKGDED